MGIQGDGGKRPGYGRHHTWKRVVPGLLAVVIALVVAVVATGIVGGGGAGEAASATSASAEQDATDTAADSTAADSYGADQDTQATGQGGSTGSSQGEGDGDESSSSSGDDGASYEDGVVLLRVAEGQSAEDIDAALAQLDCVNTKSVDDQDLSNGLVRVATSEGISVEDAVSQLEGVGLDSQPNYAYALADDEKDALSLAKLTNDPYLSASGSGAANYEGLNDTEVTEAWDLVQTDKTVSLAVLDTGIRSSHEDLKDNVVATYDATVANSANGLDGDVTDATDVEGHGTHVAGIVAAEANNAKGVAGTSYNAGIVGVKVFPTSTFTTPAGTKKLEGNCYTDDLVCAYNYVIQNASAYNIRVVNMSVGGALSSLDAALSESIEKAYEQGIVTVCAAGNQNSALGLTVPYLSAPAVLSAHLVAVMNVAYTNGAWTLSSSSNYNTTSQASSTSNKNICAPGTSILSTLRTGDSSYGQLSGTSMASPWVAGVLAMEFAANSSLSAEQAIDYLYESAEDLGTAGWDRQTGYGLVNAYKAVSLAKGTQVVSLKDISLASVATIPSQVYTGSAIAPAVTVTFEGFTLTEGTDYTVAYSNNVDPGTATVTITGIGGYTGSTSLTFMIVEPPVATVPMYRLYNRWSGEHLFTTDYSEYSYLGSIGWSQEGVAWYAPASGGTPVWRLYNPYSGDHLYTGSASEYAYLGSIGWRQEGESFRSADASSGGAPIYRLYNRWLTAGTHLFTTDYSEYSYLGTLGWSQEGEAFYAAK